MNRAVRQCIALAVASAAFAFLGAAPASAGFGLHDLSVEITQENGSPETRAGAHPFEFTTSLKVNTLVNSESLVLPDEQVKSLRIDLPPGLVGDPAAVPRCAAANFNEIVENTYTTCPDETAVGIAGVTAEFVPVKGGEQGFFYVPVYNLEPSPGSVARLGFAVLGIPVRIDVRINPEAPHNVIASVSNVTQAAFFDGASLTLWGNPADPAHDPLRGTCIDSEGGTPTEPVSRGICPAEVPDRPFLTLPRSCTGPLQTRFAASSWQSPDAPPFEAASSTPGMTGCAALRLGADVGAVPTTQAAESASGLDFSVDIEDEGLTAPDGIAQSDLREANVTLPTGMTLNPAAADGLAGCSEAQLAEKTLISPPWVGCPETSKVGSVEVETPLLEGEILHGSVYVAAQDANLAHSTFAVYMVIEDRDLGVLVKLPGKLEIDPASGRIVTTFGEAPYEVPQIPFSHLRFHFRGGPRGPLATPPSCGRYSTEAAFVPWSEGASFDAPSAFDLVSGAGGGPCPSSGGLPFHPGFDAGSLDNTAGAWSPFNLRLTREDGEREIGRLSSVLPPGLLAKIAGVGRCSEAEIAAARMKTGREELASPSCPADAQIGRVVAGAGVSAATYLPGKVYLAGALGGAPLSVVVITPAVAGPFDIGTVVVREGLSIDPDNAQAEVGGAASDPIPYILKGIPLKLRDLRVYADRPEFTVNPTSCDPLAALASVLGGSFALSSPVATADLSARYQARGCARLGFKPKLVLGLSGKTERGGAPRLKAVLSLRKGDTNIGRARVTLPHSIFLEQAHIRGVCTRVQFAAGAGDGRACPKGSVYGRAKAVSPLLDEPLVGSVYLRSSNHPLPDLVAALRSSTVDINLVSRIDSVKGGIRNSFEAVPDAPVTKFVLEMQGGKKGLLVNSTDICQGKHRARASFTGQNGKLHVLRPLVKARCGGKHKRRSKH